MKKIYEVERAVDTHAMRYMEYCNIENGLSFTKRYL
jgi:hypothetical protein